jgi:hypothetical protein
MRSIYKNALLTLQATASAAVNAGCFFARKGKTIELSTQILSPREMGVSLPYAANHFEVPKRMLLQYLENSS